MKVIDYCRDHTFCGEWMRAIVYYWNHPWMLKWGRLILLFVAMIASGTIINYTDVEFDGPIIVTVIVSWLLGTIASIKTTRVYSARGLGLLGTVVGDIVVYSGFIVGLYQIDSMRLPWLPDLPLPERDWILDYGRGAFAVAAPLFAFGLIMSWYKDRKLRKEACGDNVECHEEWKHLRHTREYRTATGKDYPRTYPENDS